MEIRSVYSKDEKPAERHPNELIQFLTEENFWDKYHKAKDWTQQWTKPFDEFSRIARNEVSENVPEQYARVSDGTSAALIRKTPKRIIQQLPTGVITSDDDDDWLPIIAEFILLNRIIPYANGSYDLIQKWWSALEKSLTFGGTAVYTPFVKRGNEFTADASLIYWGDIFFQPGQSSFYDCDYFFIRSYWQPEKIDQIIESEKERAKQAKADGIEYTPTWDIKALKEAKKHLADKEEDAKTRSEKKYSIDNAGIEVVIGYQKGVGATFYTGCPNEEGNNGTIVRRKKNKDPRGLPPVDYFYADVDGSNPFGRSIVELIGGIQNAIDDEMRAFKYIRALCMDPPMMVFGNVDVSQGVYEPHSYVDMGDASENNALKPFDVNTSAIERYPDIYALNKTQLYALFNSGGDTTISSEVGNPGFGKTPTALKQQKEMMTADDNYLRKNFESFFENWAETAINVYFSEREGVEELQLDQKTADKLRKLVNEGKLDEGFVKDNNTVIIDYSLATSALHFRVDASTSKLNGQSEQLESLQLLLEIAANPMLSQIVTPDILAECWNKIVANSGVEDSEDLVVNSEEISAMLQQQQAPDVESAQEGSEIASDEVLPAQTTELPQTTEQTPLHPDTQSETENVINEIVSILRSRGIPDTLITNAIQAIIQGGDPAEVVSQLERLVNGR